MRSLRFAVCGKKGEEIRDKREGKRETRIKNQERLEKRLERTEING
jgi:hypothetical protein